MTNEAAKILDESTSVTKTFALDQREGGADSQLWQWRLFVDGPCGNAVLQTEHLATTKGQYQYPCCPPTSKLQADGESGFDYTTCPASEVFRSNARLEPSAGCALTEPADAAHAIDMSGASCNAAAGPDLLTGPGYVLSQAAAAAWADDGPACTLPLPTAAAGSLHTYEVRATLTTLVAPTAPGSSVPAAAATGCKVTVSLGGCPVGAGPACRWSSELLLGGPRSYVLKLTTPAFEAPAGGVALRWSVGADVTGGSCNAGLGNEVKLRVEQPTVRPAVAPFGAALVAQSCIATEAEVYTSGGLYNKVVQPAWPAAHKDMWGPDLERFEGATLGACKEKCESIELCAGVRFVWDYGRLAGSPGSTASFPHDWTQCEPDCTPWPGRCALLWSCSDLWDRSQSPDGSIPEIDRKTWATWRKQSLPPIPAPLNRPWKGVGCSELTQAFTDPDLGGLSCVDSAEGKAILTADCSNRLTSGTPANSCNIGGCTEAHIITSTAPGGLWARATKVRYKQFFSGTSNCDRVFGAASWNYGGNSNFYRNTDPDQPPNFTVLASQATANVVRESCGPPGSSRCSDNWWNNCGGGTDHTSVQVNELARVSMDRAIGIGTDAGVCGPRRTRGAPAAWRYEEIEVYVPRPSDLAR